MATQTQVKAAAKAANVSAKWSSEWQEWTIRKNGCSAETEYYASDNDDALDQIAYLATLAKKLGRKHPSYPSLS